ncbi:MAG: DUF2235 domain-containing protein [SAR202 cluster bacterium]|jgi:uncharacterized protein (DUF2235 family)|nr:DUF2235 domain-containing protein [SAR202 cluster bacterium]MDP6664984.1 DUF2235 domain-containing protein [SAR202 cluster bacterium]MDP6798637.1 DUF2235 domain-containing protein [SAR202 cluster bacterium]MQG69742.1 DUF2235 domain-containing protein [SAR202 cluster bacterium]HAL47792.1 hypothetical protein [Dehalococcoidia bacterium]|tara:strand:- start:4199 stop:5236 length:1038 start_codon:yes stop_codon:yes gene_type:complete
MTKRIVICCDGTWNIPDQPNPTNVVKLARAILPEARDGTCQVVFYDAGVRTGGLLDHIRGGAFGKGILKNIEDSYRFLMHNYSPGDQVFLFGFSRGAYTARSTVGLIRNCGLLEKEHADRFQDAIALYRHRVEGPDSPRSIEFRNRYSREIEIDFLGVWDTVGALGIPARGLNRLTRKRHQFHDVRLTRIVRRGYQALAIDERRFAFRPSIWEAKPREGQTVEQVWFAGSHSDVGGGYRAAGLAGVASNWMVQKAEDAGLEFDAEYIAANVQPAALDYLHDSRTSFYRLSPPHTREIAGNEATNEAVHPAAVSRFETAAPSYKPSNLQEYLADPTHAIADVRDSW